MNKIENNKPTWKRNALQKNVRKMFNLDLTNDEFCYNINKLNRIPTTESFKNLEKFVYADINYLFYLIENVHENNEKDIKKYDHFLFNNLSDLSEKLKNTNTTKLKPLTDRRKKIFEYYKKRMNWIVTKNCSKKLKDFLENLVKKEPANITEFSLAAKYIIEIERQPNLVNLMCNNETFVKKINTDNNFSKHQESINNINEYIKKGEHFPVFLIMNNEIKDYSIENNKSVDSKPRTENEKLTQGENTLEKTEVQTETNIQYNDGQINNCGILYVLSFMQKEIHKGDIYKTKYFGECKKRSCALMQENYPQLWADIKKIMEYEKDKILHDNKQIHPKDYEKQSFYIELAKYIRKKFIDDESFNQVGPILNQIHNFNFKNDDRFENINRHDFLENIITNKLLGEKIKYPKLRTLENNTIKINDIVREREKEEYSNKAIVKFWEISLDTNVK